MSATTITVPADLAAAATRLDHLEHLATATGWERAAIVWAHCAVRAPAGAQKLDVQAFARLKIAGLRKRDTVAHYLAAWDQAMAAGKAVAAVAGQPVALPDLPWPPQPAVARNVGDPEARQALTAQAAVDGVGASKVLDVASNPRAVAAAIKGSPQLAKAAREALRERDRLDDATTQATIDQAARRAGRAVERALGVDPVASHLRAAAAELGQAILEVDLSGVQDEAQVRHALDLVDRYRAMFRQGAAAWSDADRSFLAEHGVQL